MAEDLYERDYFAWTVKQAEALRARAAGSDALDYDHLAEEVAQLGNEQLHACESFIIQIFAHFLKLEHWRFSEPAAGWRREIVVFRDELERRLTATLTTKLQASLPKLYAQAVRRARAGFAADEPSTAFEPPEASPYTWEDMLGRGEEWFPDRVGEG